MNSNFERKLQQVYEQMGDHAIMVLATSCNDRVSARKMSFIIDDGLFYFQTDNTFRKYQDIKANPHVALCFDNIQMEGICEELGCPLEHLKFCDLFKKYFSSSYEAYSSLTSERLFVIRPAFMQRWNYVENQSVIEQFHMEQQEYTEKYYRGF